MSWTETTLESTTFSNQTVASTTWTAETTSGTWTRQDPDNEIYGSEIYGLGLYGSEYLPYTTQSVSSETWTNQ